MTPQARANDHYLMQRVMGSSPEQLVALLLEGAQRFLGQAVQAMGRKDIEGKAKALDRVFAILEELENRLDFERGGELAQNLFRLYQWWGREALAAGAALDTKRIERVSTNMGEIRLSWEQAFRQRVEGQGQTAFKVGDMVG